MKQLTLEHLDLRDFVTIEYVSIRKASGRTMDLTQPNMYLYDFMRRNMASLKHKYGEFQSNFGYEHRIKKSYLEQAKVIKASIESAFPYSKDLAALYGYMVKLGYSVIFRDQPALLKDEDGIISFPFLMQKEADEVNPEFMVCRGRTTICVKAHCEGLAVGSVILLPEGDLEINLPFNTQDPSDVSGFRLYFNGEKVN